MKRILFSSRTVAEDDVFELIEKDEDFKEFVGKVLTHFEHFVLPIRDQSYDIEQDYQIPERVDIATESMILVRWTRDNTITISFARW